MIAVASPSPPSEEKKLLRVREVAQRLSLSRTATYELLASGRLRSVKIGKSRRVMNRDLENFIDSLTGSSDRPSDLDD